MKKRFAIDYQNVLDWNETVPLQSEELEFVEQTTYDALNRPITITQPDTTVASYVYNKGGLLEQVLHDATEYISNINYNEKGQRSKISYGNNTQTLYTYNPKNFRLTNIYTKRNSDSNALQDLNFTFDAVGNIVQQNDDAQQLYYYSNQVIAPNATYTYDPLYRLINATGRELTNLTAPTPNDFTNSIGVPNTAANAMQTYNHTYEFDELGNMQSDNWKDYVYDTTTNRLLKHDPDQTLNDYTYDVHGNMLTMPHLTSMVWDFADRLQSAGNGTFTSYYNYDLEGNRSRKVVVKSNIREERYYMGDYEIYRKYVNDTKTLERSTVHIIDDRDRFAMIETETGNTPVVRYQYNNHLGSACLELDTTAAIISYEEYYPYGTTSYRSGRTETEVSLKRYKYVGKERDEETGLYYYGARYYAAWLCRFVSVDPLQFKYPIYTPYQYAGNQPIIAIDLDGLEPFMPDSAMAPKTQSDNYVCFDNSNIQVPYKIEDNNEAITVSQNNVSSENATANYWKYDSKSKTFINLGSNTNAPFNINNKNYILKEGGTDELVTPENYKDVQSQFFIFPANETVDLIQIQYDQMVNKKDKIYVEDNKYTYVGTNSEKGGFQASKGKELKPVASKDGAPSKPEYLDGEGVATVDPKIAIESENNAENLQYDKGYSIDIFYHFHCSAILWSSDDSNSISYRNTTLPDNLWKQTPSKFDKDNVAGYKRFFNVSTVIQFSTNNFNSEAHFYNDTGTLNIPMKSFLAFYN